MPIHDWTRVRPGTFHNFHYHWLAAIANRLNAGVLPPDHFALAEQYVKGPEGDVVTLSTGLPTSNGPVTRGSGPAVMAKPTARFVQTADAERYARKADHIAVRHEFGHVVAVIEVVSPGNKASRHALKTFAEKATGLLRRGVNLLIIDILPPGNLDPQGIHPVVWDDMDAGPFELPADAPLTLAAYQASPLTTAYVEPAAVGGPVPAMPLFLDDEWHVMVPLDDTYAAAWEVQPAVVRRQVTGDQPA